MSLFFFNRLFSIPRPPRKSVALTKPPLIRFLTIPPLHLVHQRENSLSSLAPKNSSLGPCSCPRKVTIPRDYRGCLLPSPVLNDRSFSPDTLQVFSPEPSSPSRTWLRLAAPTSDLASLLFFFWLFPNFKSVSFSRPPSLSADMFPRSDGWPLRL